MCKILLSLTVLLLLFNSMLAQLNPDDVNEFFKEDTVPRIDIFIDPDSLAILLEDIASDYEYQATFVFNNHLGICDTIENVGFRLRGNYSRTADKKSFKISINSFSPGRKYYGLEKINLKATVDDSFIRTKLSWYLCRQMGIPSIWVSHVMLYINNELWGVYTNVEHIDEEYVKKEFGNNNGNLYRCRYPASLEWISNNPDDYKLELEYLEGRFLRVYELKTNTRADDYTDLQDLIIDLSNSANPNFKNLISERININSLLKFFALEFYLGHWDSYSFIGNNYYLYHNTATNKFEYITYDMDGTMGILRIGGKFFEKDIYNFTSDAASFPLRTNILEIPEYRNNYTFYLKQLITRFPPDTLRKLAEQIQDFIAPFVVQDPFRTFDMEEFYTSLDSTFGWSEYGIIEYFSQRYNSILSQLDNSNTSPIISNVSYSTTHINDTVKISCTVEDDDPDPLVRIYYQLNDIEIISKEMNLISQGPLMGLSNYEIIIDPMKEPGILSFFIEATDEKGQILRSPYEKNYCITIYSDNSDLRINEILAANTSCMTDEYGDQDDWIEIYNSDTVTLSLNNKYLTDSCDTPDEWQLPAVYLKPGEFAWFWADNEPGQGVNHAEFRLSRNGETIYLFEEREKTFYLLDSLNYPEQEPNISYGILPDNVANTGFLSQITPGFMNDAQDLAFMIFNVNMIPMIKSNYFNPENDILDVVGDFNNWTGSFRFHDSDEDSIYTQIVYGLLMGEKIQYRFRLNQDNDLIEFNELPGSEGHRVYLLEKGCNTQYHYFNDITTDINNSQVPEIMLYPMPVVDYVHLRFNQAVSNILLTDINGRIIKQLNVEQNLDIKVDLKELPAGIYFIKIISETKTVRIEKILKL